MNLPLIKARSLVKNFTNPFSITILNGIDLDIYAGESVAIGGRSGQGKSTLLQILGTLDTPTSGSLEILDTSVSKFNASSLRCKHIGFVFQSYYLLADFTALDNVLMAARIARQSTAEGSPAYLRAVSLLERVGLGERLHHSTKLLSGGEKQRVAIARALCNNPDIILADEPTGNLDKTTAEDIYSILLETVQKENKALVVVTHDPILMERCSKRYTLSQGTLQS
ncbi:MAG: ABC transporter ATP-binding protein [Parachlamydiales bacterium]|jgi:lipoprotein-releasing system ATP-binding protein